MLGLLWDAVTHSEEGEGRGSRLVAAVGALGLGAVCLAVGWWLLDGFTSGVEDMHELNRRPRGRGNPIGMLGIFGVLAMGLGGLFALLGVVLGFTALLPKRG